MRLVLKSTEVEGCALSTTAGAIWRNRSLFR
jgi:hypothetical protein